MENDGNTTEVEIFGAVYRLRGEDRNYLQELADIVDGKMREVAEHVSTVDPAKIAILAAMNLADELSRAERRQEGKRTEIEERVEALAGELSAALDS